VNRLNTKDKWVTKQLMDQIDFHCFNSISQKGLSADINKWASNLISII